METALKSHVNDVFLRSNFRKEDARFLSELLAEIDQKQAINDMENKDYFLNKDDKVELIEKIGDVKTELTDKIGEVRTELIERIGGVKTELNKSIYIVGLVQLVTIIASVLAIVNFMLK